MPPIDQRPGPGDGAADHREAVTRRDSQRRLIGNVELRAADLALARKLRSRAHHERSTREGDARPGAGAREGASLRDRGGAGQAQSSRLRLDEPVVVEPFDPRVRRRRDCRAELRDRRAGGIVDEQRRRRGCSGQSAVRARSVVEVDPAGVVDHRLRRARPVDRRVVQQCDRAVVQHSPSVAQVDGAELAGRPPSSRRRGRRVVPGPNWVPPFQASVPVTSTSPGPRSSPFVNSSRPGTASVVTARDLHARAADLDGSLQRRGRAEPERPAAQHDVVEIAAAGEGARLRARRRPCAGSASRRST